MKFIHHNLKSCTALFFAIAYSAVINAQDLSLKSPDGKLEVVFKIKDKRPYYSVLYNKNMFLEESPLGLKTNEGDFITDIGFVNSSSDQVKDSYSVDRIKKSQVEYEANKLTVDLENNDKKQFSITFQVSDNDIALRYELPTWGETRSVVIQQESTGFKFPAQTTSFLSDMMQPMKGFARTAPSYESGYIVDAPIQQAKAQAGYVFPALFKVGDKGWTLISETGVRGLYCASHLSPVSADGVFSVNYPDPLQNNGFGSTGAAIALPGVTPWRTITVGESLKPIVETTIPFDVVKPLYEASQEYQYGKSTWSWIVWQDESMNWDDQVTFIDLSSELGYHYILVDALWDANLGKEKLEELVKYAKSKDVEVLLWYNSNGPFNDAPQGPHSKMSASIERKEEMKWLQKIGVKGLKVDFFGGDKQETMRLYEDILSDANDHGLMIFFHGTTIPRGWERMFPNYVGSEAVLASEMLIFSEDVRKKEAFYATLHPFIRNTVGSMEFGGVLLNKYLTKSNKERNKRLTTDAFQLATAVLFQNPIQPFGLTPNNLTDVPAFEIDFMKNVPTTWDETVLIDGYPGKYIVLARRHQEQWYVAAINAEGEALKLKVKLPMLAGKKLKMIGDNNQLETKESDISVAKNGETNLTVQPKGGLVIY